MNSDLTNAVAGPSNHRPSPPPMFPPFPSTSTPHPPPSLYLPPPGPPLFKQHLASTQDLLSRFQLLSAYDKYVRPFATQYGDDGQIRSISTGPTAFDKGKGREVDTSLAAGQGQTTGGPGTGVVEGVDGEDEDGGTGKGEKKKKNSYKALIKGIPGKHSMKKDDYLTSMMRIPPKQPTRIVPFDARTQHEAFTVSPEGLKGWNVTALILESAQEREGRKKRKELKRLAKAQQAQAAAAIQAGATPIVAQPQPMRAGAYRGTSDISQAGASTPKPIGTPRPMSTVPRPGSAVPRPGSTVPRPGSTVPRPGSTAPKQDGRPGKPNLPPVQVPIKAVSTPSRTTTPTSATMVVDVRGKKRDREDGLVTPVNAYGNGSGAVGTDPYVNGNGAVNGVGNGLQKLNAKAGIAGVRPRPIKKQRMDIQGQARDVTTPVQQPTPQGV